MADHTESLTQGIALAPPPVDPITTAIFLGTLIGGPLFRALFGGDSQEDRARNFSQAIQDTYGSGEFSVEFAGFTAFRATEGSPIFFSRQIFDPTTGLRAGTAFFNATDGSLAQVRDAQGNITNRIPGIVSGRFVWGDKEGSGDKLEGSLELALKNELKNEEPVGNLEQSEETRARARCTGSGLSLVNGTHCATPEAVSACNTAGGRFENGVCVTPPLGPDEQEPEETTFEADVNDCEQRGGVVVDGKCEEPSSLGPDLVGSPRIPSRSRTGVSVPLPGKLPGRSRSGTCPEGQIRDDKGNCVRVDFQAEATDCPEGEILVNGVCVDPSTPTDQIPRGIPPRARIPTEKFPNPDVLPPGVVPPVPPIQLPDEEPRGPRVPNLNLSGLAVPPAGGGFSFLGPLTVGASPRDTLFPTNQARPAVPGSLLQFIANLRG